MGQSTDNQPNQGTTRRVFLKQVFALTGVTAGAVLLNACGASGATATAVPAAVQQPTALAITAPVPTTAATTTAASTTSQGATPTIVAAANAFLATLSATEKSSMLFDWSN